MSCYTRHLGDLLPANPTPQDKRALDQAVRAQLGTPEPEHHCREVWAAVKAERARGRLRSLAVGGDA